jgi:uncharacterized coiled-coil DUF342 family protein
MSKRTSKTSETDTLAFAKAINKLIQKQDDFSSAIKDLNNLKADTLTGIQLELKSKRDELDNLVKQYDVQKKDLEIKIDQECKEYSYQKATEILEERGEVAVDDEEYEELKESVDAVREELETEMEVKVKEQQQKGHQELSQALKNKQLEHKAEIATLTATVQQLTKERGTFETTIDNLRSEIAAQRELTKQVAQAGKQGAISQSFGK